MTMKADREKSKPAWGRAALFSALGTVLLSYVSAASNSPSGTVELILAVGLAVSAVLAIVSLARGEKRALAVVTVSLVLATPVVLFVGVWVFFRFFYVG